MNDPYKILGITRNASDDEVKKAYRTLSKKYHPDANVGSPHLAEYTEMFKRVQNAYDQIMDERKGGGNPFQQQGFGGFGGYQNTYQQHSYGNENTDFQAATNFINMGRYQDAYNLLQRMSESDRDAQWYFLTGMSMWGLGNKIAATENIKKACEMDPSNQQYRQVLAQIQSGRMGYQRMQSPFGGPAGNCNSGTLCCQIMLCSICFSRGGFICYPLLCC